MGGREGGMTPRVGWVSVIVIGDDYDAFLLSCDLYNLFLIASQLSDISSSIFVEIHLCTLLSVVCNLNNLDPTQ